jgi:Xaa-Pro aminopeptidase
MRGPKRFLFEDLQAAMERRDLDGVVAVMPENVLYASGTLIMTSWEIRDRLALAVFPNGGEPTMVVCNIEESLARAESWIRDIRTYVERVESPIDVLADVLAEKDLDDKKVGTELTYLAAEYYLALTERLPDLNLVASETLFDELRAIKSDEEVALLKHAANVTEEAIYGAFAAAQLGSTEKEIANGMMSRLLALGADENAFCVLGAGQNVQYTHAAPGPKQIGEGEVVRVDFGGRFDGYYSDVARPAVGGKPTRRHRHLYRALREIQRETIAQMLPGVQAADVFNYCVTAFEERGLAFSMPHIGHGLGIGLHEYPMIEPGSDSELKAGMVINIEPIYADIGSNIVFHLEDLVHVTSDGPVLLSDYSDTEELFCIE